METLKKRGRIPPKTTKPFTTENQPSPEAKSQGWKKRRYGTNLLKFILRQKFIGAKNSELKIMMAQYYGCEPNDITIEMMMDFRQTEKAISKSDTQAYKIIKDRIYGLPKQLTELTGKDGDKLFPSWLTKMDKI